MTDDKLDELERLAKAATIGPWYCDKEMPWIVQDCEQTLGMSYGHSIAELLPSAPYSYGMTSCCRNSMFIAASSPDVVIALIAELKRWRALPKKMVERVSLLIGGYDELIAEAKIDEIRMRYCNEQEALMNVRSHLSKLYDDAKLDEVRGKDE